MPSVKAKKSHHKWFMLPHVYFSILVLLVMELVVPLGINSFRKLSVQASSPNIRFFSCRRFEVPVWAVSLVELHGLGDAKSLWQVLFWHLQCDLFSKTGSATIQMMKVSTDIHSFLSYLIKGRLELEQQHSLTLQPLACICTAEDCTAALDSLKLWSMQHLVGQIHLDKVPDCMCSRWSAECELVKSIMFMYGLLKQS